MPRHPIKAQVQVVIGLANELGERPRGRCAAEPKEERLQRPSLATETVPSCQQHHVSTLAVLFVQSRGRTDATNHEAYIQAMSTDAVCPRLLGEPAGADGAAQWQV